MGGKEDGMAASGIQIIVKIKDLRSWFGVDFDVLLQSNMAGYLGKDDGAHILWLKKTKMKNDVNSSRKKSAMQLDLERLLKIRHSPYFFL